MKTIWKYPLTLDDLQTIEMPKGSKILHVEFQETIEAPCLWALVDPQKDKERIRLVTHGTGYPVRDTTGKHLGSYQMRGGQLVFHVFIFNATADRASDSEFCTAVGCDNSGGE